jgi:lysophospholipid acyltransferase (LPLAT)-like uncharacterized protein
MTAAARPEAAGWRLRWLVAAGTALLRLLAITWRIDVRNGHIVEDLRSRKQPLIFALWHGQLLPLLWVHRGQGVAVLISEHRDGEIVARVAHSLGFRTVRGSTSRGAGRALIRLARELDLGRDVAITPDGPRGPARSFAPGALVTSQRSSAPVVAAAASASRAWRLKSWDRFLIPKPFARVVVSYSQPMTVTAATAREATSLAPVFQELLDRNSLNAES